MKTTMMILAVSLVTSFAQAQAPSSTPNPTVSADKSSVNSVCSTEAQTAGCGGETVGHGLLKCVNAYRKTHADFKVSAPCKQAIKKLRSDKKAAKSSN